MKPFKQKTKKLNCRTLILSLVFFLFTILSFHLVFTNSVQAETGYTKKVEKTNLFSINDMTTGEAREIQNYQNNPHYEECSLGNITRCLILVIFKFSGFLLGVAATVFSWMISTTNIKLVISDNTALYSSWTVVRDILNMAFIMVLLFSAFCTIFQVEQYNYKKMLWKIVLMALLVNFSFPITRFIIDASNILMYTILKSLFVGASPEKSFSIITRESGLGKLLATGGTVDVIDNTLLLANTIMLFMLAVTFLAIGILLIIRLIVLAILIIFSPIAFVGTILPGASSYASKWWDNLFKYSFFGPIIIFGVSIAVKLMTDENMQKIGDSAKKAATEQVGLGKGIDVNYIGELALVSLPIVLLWIVMGVAQFMSIAGAGAVMGGAQKVMKGAGKWAGKAPVRAGWWGIKKTGVPGGIQQKWKQFKETGILGSQKTAQREAQIAAGLGVTGATVKDAETRAAEYEKNHESDASLIIKSEGGDAGAALALVKRGKMDEKIYGKFVTNTKDDQLKEHVAKKVKKNRIDILIKHTQGDAAKIAKVKQEIATKTSRPLSTITDNMAKSKIAENEMKKLNPEDIKSQYWGDILDTATPDIKRATRRMFAGLADDAKKDIAKGQSSYNRKNINALRSGGII